MTKSVTVDFLIKAKWDGKDLSRGQRALRQMTKIGVASTGIAAAGVAAFAVESVKAFSEFEKGMNEVFTLMPTMSEKAFGEMSDQVLELATEMNRLPEEVVPALYQAISAGVPPDNALEFMEIAAKAARGGVTELETAVDGITSVVNAFGSETISATEAADKMFTAVRLGKTTFEQLSKRLFQVNPVAASLGVEFGDVAAAMATLTAMGVPTRVAATQLRQVFNELSTDTRKAGEVFQELTGKTFQQFIAEGNNVQDAMDIMSNRAKELGVGTNALFSTIEAGNAALSLTSESGAAKFTQSLEQMAISAGAVDEANEKMNESFAVQVEGLQSATERFKILVGEGLLPGSQAAVEYATNTALLAGDLLVLNNAASEASDAVGDLAQELGGTAEGEQQLEKFMKLWFDLDDFWGRSVFGRGKIEDDLMRAIAANVDMSGSIEEVEERLLALDSRFQVYGDGLVALDGQNLGYIQTMREMNVEYEISVMRQEAASRSTEAYYRNMGLLTQATEEVRVEVEQTHNVYEGLIDATERLEFATAMGRDTHEEASLAYEVTPEILEEVAQRHEDAAEATEAHAEALKALELKTADYFSQVLEGSSELNIFNEELDQLGTQWYHVSNRTVTQSQLLGDLQDEYSKTEERIVSLQSGVAGVGMEEEALNEELAEQYQRLTDLQGRMDPLLNINGEWVSVTQQATINQDALNAELFRSAEEAGASAVELALLGGALGLYSDEAVEAALKSALVNIEIDRLAGLYAEGLISVEQMRGGLQEYIETLDGEMASALEEGQHKQDVLNNRASEGAGAFGTLAEKAEIASQIIDEFPDGAHVTVTSSGLDALIAKAREAAQTIRDFGQGSTSVNQNIPTSLADDGVRALGGPVTVGQSVIVGERGPELFVPSTNGNVRPFTRGNASAGGDNINITIIQRPGESARGVAYRTAEALGARTR